MIARVVGIAAAAKIKGRRKANVPKTNARMTSAIGMAM